MRIQQSPELQQAPTSNTATATNIPDGNSLFSQLLGTMPGVSQLQAAATDGGLDGTAIADLPADEDPAVATSAAPTDLPLVAAAETAAGDEFSSKGLKQAVASATQTAFALVTESPRVSDPETLSTTESNVDEATSADIDYQRSPITHVDAATLPMVAATLPLGMQLPMTTPSNKPELQRTASDTETASADRTTRPTAQAASHGHGVAVPVGGKKLPPAATLPAAVASLISPDSGIVRTAAADESVASNQLNVMSLNSTPAASQWSLNTPAATNTPSDAARNAGFTDQMTTPFLASSLGMGSTGWAEETVQQLRWLKDDDQQRAQLQLHPAELGRLDINIEIKDGQANVQLVAGNAEARDLLEKSLPLLRDLLSQHGMTLSEGQVAHQNSQGRGTAGHFPSSLPFALDEELPLAQSVVRPALRTGSSHRIDYYV